jgi:hypothetical protein
MTEETPFRIATFYRFVSIEDPGVLRQRVLELGRQVGLCGTILIAGEGINATIAARADGVDAFVEQLCEDPRFQGIEARWSLSNEQPFARFKVKVKREIVTMGVAGSILSGMSESTSSLKPGTTSFPVRMCCWSTLETTMRSALAPSRAPLILRLLRFGISRRTSSRRLRRSEIARSQCSAQVESAVRRQRRICGSEAFPKSITSREASSPIWNRCLRMKASGRAIASYSMNGSPLAMALNRKNISSVAPARSRFAPVHPLSVGNAIRHQLRSFPEVIRAGRVGVALTSPKKSNTKRPDMKKGRR